MKEQLKEFVVEALSSNLDAMKGVFNTAVNNLIEKNNALEAIVTTWKEKIVELKGELTVYKVALGNKILASAPNQHKMNFPKSNEFKETRSTRDVDNFLKEVEQYFCTIGIEDDVTKGINELTKATIEAESFVKLGCKKDKFDSFKSKEMSNGGGNHEEEHDKNNNDGSAMNGVNMKPHNEKRKTNDHLRKDKVEPDKEMVEGPQVEMVDVYRH
ncbi:hypothetical protein Goarm_023075 [Gossypium armourianum]|uniref:Uncharacterized protein n=1 Tax=Gossypium armourianum TaxID=34283 RepID=A0A7J9KI39_9ROSI|nr:hypothetical protein [Gossypium armourianum]